jgi:hypothetical protein
MKNIKAIPLSKYDNSNQYQLIESFIYKDLNDNDSTNHRIALSFELEDGEDTQYPIDDLLSEFMLYVSDFLESENQVPNRLVYELGGDLEDIQRAKSLIGKRVYNEDFVGEDGQTYVDLKIA